MNDIICTLTSTVNRCIFLHKVIKSLLNQTVKPNKILLYYQDDTINSLPESVLELRNDIFNIVLIKDTYRSYSKFKYILENNPDNIIIICDDDIEYNHKYIERLYLSHLKHKDCMICNAYHYVHEIYKSYTQKTVLTAKILSDYHVMPLSGWGTLIPPNFYKNINNIEDIFKIAPTHDELWFFYNNYIESKQIYCHGLYKKYKSICISKYLYPKRLCKINTIKLMYKYYTKLYKLMH